MQNENQVPTNVNDNDDPIIVDMNDVETLTKNFTTTLQQKKHWREKAKAIEAEKIALQDKLKELEKSAKDITKKDESPKPSDFDSLADSLDVIRDLKSDELNDLRSVSRELGVDPVKYIKSKAGQAHLKEIRATRKVDETTPSPSSRIPVFNGKPVNEILKSDKASPEEKQAAWEARMRGRGLNQNQ